MSKTPPRRPGAKPPRRRTEGEPRDERSEIRRPEAARPESPAEGVTRRTALKVLAAGAAGAAALPALSCGDAAEPGAGGEETAGPAETPTARSLAAGTPADPDLINPIVPWELVLTDEERLTLAALCDVIIPADQRSPSASALGAHDFIDEWVSAPYESNRRDLVLVRGGLVWLEIESADRFGLAFAALDDEQKRALCDDIAYQPDAAPEHRAAARFFDKVRDLTATAFWTTEEGMADLGYIGNVPMDRYDGPPGEVLERLGLA